MFKTDEKAFPSFAKKSGLLKTICVMSLAAVLSQFPCLYGKMPYHHFFFDIILGLLLALVFFKL
jgi:hypothetical protein